MNALRMIHPIQNWHDALIFIALATVLALLRVLVVLAKRVTLVSLPKKKVRFEEKR